MKKLLGITLVLAVALFTVSTNALAGEKSDDPVSKTLTVENTTTVTLSSGWEVLSVQRMALPLNLPYCTEYGANGCAAYGTAFQAAGIATNMLANELNAASERLSAWYIVTFGRTPHPIRSYEVRVETLYLKGQRIVFTR